MKMDYLLWFPHTWGKLIIIKKINWLKFPENFTVHHSLGAPQLVSCICRAFHRKINSACHKCTVTMSKLPVTFCNFTTKEWAIPIETPTSQCIYVGEGQTICCHTFHWWEGTKESVCVLGFFVFYCCVKLICSSCFIFICKCESI